MKKALSLLLSVCLAICLCPVTLASPGNTVTVTYYGSTFDLTPPDYPELTIKEEVFNLDSFESCEPPVNPEFEGYEFVCWVLYCEGADDNMICEQINAVPKDCIGNIKADENGNKHVTIHAVWKITTADDTGLTLILDGNSGTVEGKEKSTYTAAAQMGSATMVYVSAAYPQAVRPGHTFTGWYDNPECKGNPIISLEAHSFYALTDDEQHVDWEKKLPVTLYAGWDSVPYGDPNMDGHIEAGDALLVLQCAVGKIELEEGVMFLCDVDKKPGVTAADALLVLQCAVGKISVFPCEQ